MIGTASLPLAGQQVPLGAHLAGLVRPWRWSLLLIAFLVLASALSELVPPVLMRSMVDDHLAVGQREGLFMLGLWYLVATAVGHGLTFVYGYLAAAVAQSVLSELRVRLFAHLQRLPASYFDRTPLGDVISRCTADVETLDTVFTSGVATLVASLFRLVTIAAAMVVLSPLLFGLTTLVILPLVLITRFFQVRIRHAERANRTAIGLMNTHLQETLTGVEVIQAFDREPAFVERFRDALRGVVVAYNRATAYSAFYPPVTALMSSVTIAFLLWAGTRESLGTLGISIGTLTAYALLLQRFFTPVTNLGDEWQTVQSALSGAERIFEVLSLPPDEPVAPLHDQVSDSGIACNDVVFGYEEQPVLRGLSLHAAPGEHVALVGRTGAGKTSIISLLAGLYTPWGGTVRVAGEDPRALSDEERRHVVGLVPQTAQLFSGTVHANLTLNDETVPESAVVDAAQISGADGFIRALPDGYRTMLRGAGRGRGVQLSAGQEQLLALTRALIWHPAVLLLDEATAAVDGASDGALQESLRRRVLPTGTAVLTIAHRLTTARNADRVVVIERGQVVEEGTPDDLIRRGGRFAGLLELEAAGWDWRSAPVREA
ncbi:MAG: ABC transporter ATP-binding protein [Dehalococcoidia bacterium]|nr:ABC transporter ATP-binding protein [Dehalococcoidia bacterium]